MKFFKNKNQERPSKGSDMAAGWIAGGITKVQHFWAKCMGNFFNRLDPRLKKIVLLSSCVFMVAYSSILVAYSFNKVMIPFTKPAALVQPLPIIKTISANPISSSIRQIEHFKHYLDSLGHTTHGQKIRDSILERRPGLLDSIRRIETIYCKK